MGAHHHGTDLRIWRASRLDTTERERFSGHSTGNRDGTEAHHVKRVKPLNASLASTTPQTQAPEHIAEAAPEPAQQAVDLEAEAKAFIYQHESGNRPDAVNQDSGSCGLGQSLPCEKMHCTLQDYACQDQFFTAYMAGKYGSWAAAKAFWLCKGMCTNYFATVDKNKTWW